MLRNSETLNLIFNPTIPASFYPLTKSKTNYLTKFKPTQYLSFTDEKDLSYPADHDPFLMTFLRPAKFYPKGALERMQKYFKFKLKYKKYCDDLTVESARIVFEDELVKYLPLRDVEGRRILYLSCGSKLNMFDHL